MTDTDARHPEDAATFEAWLEAMDFGAAPAAKALGKTERMVNNYRHGKSKVPKKVRDRMAVLQDMKNNGLPIPGTGSYRKFGRASANYPDKPRE